MLFDSNVQISDFPNSNSAQVKTYLLIPSSEKKTPYVTMFPRGSSGGRHPRRTNRLDTRTGATSRGAEGRTPELGVTGGGGEE